MAGIEQAAPARRERPRLSVRTARIDLTTAGFVVLLIALSAFLLHQGRDSTFYFDEWNVWGFRYGAGPDKWLAPINGHLCAVPILIFTVITKVFGAEDLLPFRVAVLAFHLTLLSLVYVLARPRLGGPMTLVAILPLTVVAGGWLDLLMPATGLFAIGPLIAAVGAYLALERRTTRWDVAACALLVLGMATSGEGLAVLGGFTVYFLLSPQQWRRLWVVGVPVVLYLIWRARYHPPSEFQLSDLSMVLSYVVRGVSSGLGSYTTLGDAYGKPLAVGLIGAWLIVVWRGYGASRLLPTMAAIGAAYWALIAIGRGPQLGPEEVRYVYPNAFIVFFIILSLVPLGTGAVAVRRRVPALLVAGISVFALLGQVEQYRASAAGYRETSKITLADLFAIRTAQAVVDPNFVIPQGDAQINPRGYFNAIRYWSGPPGLTEDEVRAAAPNVRDHVDTTLAKAFALTVSGVPSLEAQRLAPIAEPVAGEGGTVTADGADCWKLTAASGDQPFNADFKVLPSALGGIAVEAGSGKADVLSGRYFETPQDALGVVGPNDAGAVAIPRDERRTPWTLRVAPSGDARVCGLAR